MQLFWIQKKYKPLKKLEDDLRGALLLLFFVSVIIAGCSAGKDVYFEIPSDLKSPVKKSEFIKKYSNYFTGIKFFLDPGHGGEDRRNKGFEDEAVEADLNLRVGLALRNFLQEAGAVVQMSRVTDQTVELKQRSVISNASGSNIFISIHHNAPGKSGDHSTNYTSTYYHAKPTDYEYEPCNHDLAKYVQRDISYAMRNSGGLNSFDGTYSDYWIYPGQGFSVLRNSDIPAILVECSFNTHHIEAKKLEIPEYNEIEAWGIFRGLCRYLAAGIPSITSITNDSLFSNNNINLSFKIKDEHGIDPNSIQVEFDSSYVASNIFDPTEDILNINLPDVTSGKHILRIIVANKNGNHSFPFYKEITVLK